MTSHSIIGIIDIGKTNAKFALVDARSHREIAVRTLSNRVVKTAPYPHFDIERIWKFLKQSIRELNVEHAIDAFSTTTHGACAVLIDHEGNLALPALDYEHNGPEELASDYSKLRPDFSTGFSPLLPLGLNLGAQLFWQQRSFPTEFSNTRWILPYPQYWSYRLTGEVASEITSIGCHTDLWDLQTNDYSQLVERAGWRNKLPPMRHANDVLGPVREDLAKELDLAANIPVYCGIHDSNASLLPHLLNRETPFSVVSTGTWVIICSPGGDLTKLDEDRDCLANIDMFGHPVPSARFMGGREFSCLIKEKNVQPEQADIQRVIREEIILLPALESGTGPFPNLTAQWTHDKNDLSPEEIYVVVSFYLALVTAECLELTDGHGAIIVEGPFAQNAQYLAMLSAITENQIHADTANITGTSIGAATLATKSTERSNLVEPEIPYLNTPETLGHQKYAEKWRLKNSQRSSV